MIDKPISTLWARYVEEFTEQNLFPECCGIGFMRNSSHFAFVFCFEQDYNFKIESSFSKGQVLENVPAILGAFRLLV